MFKEFKAFLMRGNVFDLAVGVVIGAAFGKIVSSFVADIFTPALSLLMGKVDFTNLFFALDGNTYATLKEAKEKGIATINFGIFANALIDLVLVAAAIFLMIKLIGKMKPQQQISTAPTTKDCPQCFSLIHIKAKRCPNCTTELVEV
ncbi:MAG: large conductance mechanosensitive channel protein MscL [Pseudobdellovibrionaceae bacterium]